MNHQQDRARLGRYVLYKRRELGYRERQPFAEAIGLSEKTIGRLERGERAGPTVLSDVETFFGWKPGDADRIMNGGEPSGETPASSAPTGRQRGTSLVEDVADLVRLLGKEEAATYLLSLVERAARDSETARDDASTIEQVNNQD